jgi:AraC-like DNA-binding protein
MRRRNSEPSCSISRKDAASGRVLRNGDLSLAEIAARAGFSDQSVFCRHYKRLVGVTPGQFKMHARIA